MEERMIRLFIHTQNLREFGLHLSELCNELHQISLNAAISASHMENTSTQFPVLAAQIGKVANSISDSLTEIDRVSTRASNCILEALESALLASKYLKVRSLMKGKSVSTDGKPNQSLTLRPILAETIKKSTSVVERERDCFRESIIGLLQQVHVLEQTFTKSWGIVPYLRIAVHSSGIDESESFLDIAKTIEQLNEAANGLIRNFHKTAKEAEELSNFIVTNEGLEDAS